MSGRMVSRSDGSGLDKMICLIHQVLSSHIRVFGFGPRVKDKQVRIRSIVVVRPEKIF